MKDRAQNTSELSKVHFAETPTLSEMNKAINAENWVKATSCLACGCDDIKFFANIRSLDYSRCAECGFTFANPVPSLDDIDTFYNSPFYNNYRVLESSKIRNDKFYSVSFEANADLANWVDIDLGAHILDFGCGPGSFVAYMREQGFSNTDGFELNRRSADVARECYDLELITDTQSLPLEKYDLVVLIEVVEHLADPVSVLEDIKPHIKPGGRMLITTDSVRNFVSRQFPAYSSHFTGPSHISLFTEQAMSAMLGKIGFEVEKIETSKSVETFGYLIASPFYTLDFLSPQSESDTSDLLLVPSGFGKMLGLKPVRTMPLPLLALRKIDHLITSAIGRFAPDLSTEGMTVLARKK